LHRGGSPGFVRVEENRISWPDFVGNNMFNTLGNIERNPKVGLLFVDFESTETIQLSGAAYIDWEAEDRERRTRMDVDVCVRRSSALPLVFGTPEPSPFNP